MSVLVAFSLRDHFLGRGARRPTRIACFAPVAAALAVAALVLAGLVPGASAHASAAHPPPPPPTPAQELARIATAPSATTPGTVRAHGPLVWAAPVGIDGGPINGLACPSISQCVAADNAGRVLTSADPLGGASKWQIADVDAGNSLTALACPSAAMCAAVDGVGNAVTSSDPFAPGPAWSVARVDASIAEPSPYGGGPGLLRGLSCPSVSFCLAVDSVGNVVVSGAPTGGSAAWGAVHIDSNSDYGCAGGGLSCQAPLMGVSCPAPSLCAAVDFTGDILQTATPAGPAAWPSEPVGGGGPRSLWSVSCPTVSFCATVDGAGGHVFTWNPAAPAAVTAIRLPIDAFGIWCRSPALCLATGAGAKGTAEVVGSTAPAAKSPAWAVTGFGLINAVSCPTPSACLAADNEGDVILGVTVTSLTAALRHVAIGGRIPRIGALARRRGYALTFASPLAGELRITWQAPGGRAAAVLATAAAHFTGPQTRTVRVRLTASGRSLLAASSRLGVTATATYETNTGAVSAQRRLTLSARG